MNRDQVVSRVVSYLEEGNAHASLHEATAELPPEHRCTVPDPLPYSIWDLLEHIRIAQRDIVGFCANPDHASPEFPGGYWPETVESVPDEDWFRSIEAIDRDTDRMVDLLRDPDRDPTESFPWGDGQSLLQEAQVLIDHRSYHTGQIIVIRRMLGIWHRDSAFSV